MYELIIFDFDETLLRLHISWSSVKGEVLALAASENITIDPKLHLVPLGNRLSENPQLRRKIDDIYLKYETECAESKNYELFEGLAELVKELKRNGKMLAIASGNHSKSIKRILAQLGLDKYFDFVCGRDIPELNKPSPDPLLLILDKLGVEKERAIFVGDSINDELSAKEAGISYFRIRPGSKDGLERLKSILSSQISS